MVFRRESVSGIELEIDGLMADHFEEVGAFEDLTLNPKIEFYHRLEKADALRVFSARDNHGNLCGYALFFVQVHPHFEVKQAMCDLIYMMPEHRLKGHGREFIEFCEKSLMNENDIKAIYFSSTSKRPIGKIFERLGYKPIEMRFGKRVN